MRTLLPPNEIRLLPRRKPLSHPATTALPHSKYSIRFQPLYSFSFSPAGFADSNSQGTHGRINRWPNPMAIGFPWLFQQHLRSMGPCSSQCPRWCRRRHLCGGCWDKEYIDLVIILFLIRFWFILPSFFFPPMCHRRITGLSPDSWLLHSLNRIFHSLILSFQRTFSFFHFLIFSFFIRIALTQDWEYFLSRSENTP